MNYYLVHFQDENLYHICKQKDLRIINGVCVVKYGSVRCESTIVCKNIDFALLDEIKSNILNNLPILKIDRTNVRSVSEEEISQEEISIGKTEFSDGETTNIVITNCVTNENLISNFDQNNDPQYDEVNVNCHNEEYSFLLEDSRIKNLENEQPPGSDSFSQALTDYGKYFFFS
jgi:hypothetical protein